MLTHTTRPRVAHACCTGTEDPPEMELGVGLFGFIPFWYPIGGPKLAAVATNYIPSPALVNPAAAQPPNPKPTPTPGHSNCSSLFPRADGPVAAQEWWVAANTGTTNPAAASAWLRPFTHQTQLSGNAGLCRVCPCLVCPCLVCPCRVSLHCCNGTECTERSVSGSHRM